MALSFSMRGKSPITSLRIDCLTNNVHQLPTREWLRKEMQRAGTTCLFTCFRLVEGTDKDDSRARAHLEQAFVELESREPRKLNVEDQAGRPTRVAVRKQILGGSVCN